MRPSLLILLLVSASLQAGELLHQGFDGSTLPKDWIPGGRPNSWSVVDGALQGACESSDDHGPSISVPLPMKNGTVEFRVKLDQGGNCLMLIDGESAFGGQAHLLRVGLRPGGLTLQQDRGAPASKMEQKKAKDAAKKAGQSEPKPTAGQLADPTFYRIEKIAASLQPGLKAGEWATVKVNVTGQTATVWLNGMEAAKGNGTVLDVPKARLVFLVGGGKKVWIDDVRAVAE